MAIKTTSPVNSEFVERYQLELKRNPRSRVFAPLAEAYRKMGFIEEAKRVCRFGCEANPDFAGGHVAYANALLDSKASTEALVQLEKATKLSPDNLLAHHLLGETLIELRKPKEALKAFKMVLFLDPANERAQAAVKKWEFLTADEYGEDVFARASVSAPPTTSANAQAVDDELEDLLTESTSSGTTPSRLDLQQRHAKALERAVSLADALTVRNDLEGAIRVLDDAKRLLGPMTEIENRHKMLNKRLELDEPDQGPGIPTEASERKRAILETLLHRINERRE